MAPIPLQSLSFLLILLLLPIIFLIINHLRRRTSTNPLPPGPSPWPIIGNVLQMGKKPHMALANLAQTHGPLISLRLGTQLLVLASSPSSATEILKTHDRLLSARHISHATLARSPDDNHMSMVWALDCTHQWKFLRTLCRTHLFRAQAIDAQAALRERKVMEMVGYLAAKEGEMVKMAEVVFATIFNILGNLMFSEDLMDLEDDGGGVGGVKDVIRRMIETGATQNMGDFFPMLNGFDVQGLKKKLLECVERMFGIWEVIIKQRREEGSKQGDFLDVLLENGFSNGQISSFVLDLLTAGTDTSTSTIEWAMAELIKSPEAMSRVREELKRKINGNIVRESDVSDLSYLQACVKETLRLHPPAPLLLPHRASDACEVMNYTIPKDTRVHVNVWAIGRDPAAWKDPLQFKPERFVDSDLDYKGNDFEFIPFGSGRRICPGMPMATRQVQLILASLIHCFDWCLPDDMHHSKLDMQEKFGFTLQMEHPLLLIPKHRR